MKLKIEINTINKAKKLKKFYIEWFFFSIFCLCCFFTEEMIGYHKYALTAPISFKEAVAVFFPVKFILTVAFAGVCSFYHNYR